MKVYDAVANAFVKEGTDAVFGLLGDGQISWWESISKHPGVQIVDAREEGSALAMAEGYSRVSNGKVGVCSVTHGPGLARTALSLITATRSAIPIVVHTSTTSFNNERNYQYLNQDKFVNASEAGYIEVITPDYAEAAVRTAFYRAKLESRPIVLSIPVGVQNKECESEGDDYVTSAMLFEGQQQIRPDLRKLAQAVQIIAAAKKPVLLLGRGAMEPAASAACERLAARIGALLCTTLIAKGTLAANEFHAGISGQFATRTATQLYEEADCVIGVGAGLNQRTLAGGYLYPNARFIHIDIQPHVLMGTDRSADCYVQGDAEMTVRELDELLAKQGFSQEGFRTAAVRNALRGAHRDPEEFEIEPGTMDPREALNLMDQKLPANIGFVTGSAHNATLTPWHVQRPRPFQIFVGTFTGVGQVLGNAIGIAVATKQPIVVVDGDGSAMQNIQELDTAARLGIKMLYFIVNDEGFGAEYHRMKSAGRNANLSLQRSPDLGKVARAFGCRGRLARTVEEVSAGLDEFMAGEGPMVLDVRVSRNVLSIPYRRMYYGQDA